MNEEFELGHQKMTARTNGLSEKKTIADLLAITTLIALFSFSIQFHALGLRASC